MNGEVSIYAGPLLIAIIPLAFLVEKQKTQDPSEDSMTENTTSLYKQIFTSYSHADTPLSLLVGTPTKHWASMSSSTSTLLGLFHK